MRLRFVLDDLGEQTDEALHARAMSALGRIVQYCFRHARDPAELIRGLEAWVDLVHEVRRASHGMAALAVVWRYILLIHDEKPEVVLRQIAAALKDDSPQEDLVTAGEMLMQRGELRGQRRMLLKQLIARFGPLPVWAAARLESADGDALEAWAERFFTAATLEEAIGR